MSAIYSVASPEIKARGEALVSKHHLELANHEVKIDYITAQATVNDDGVPTGPAVTHGGYPAWAIAKILQSKDRVMGRGDCEIVIDGDRWPMLSDEQKDALLDHELYHFTLKVDKYGAVVMDDIHRPKMKLRKHDHQFGWFDEIAQRHGANSIEVGQFVNLCHDDSGQYYLPFIDVQRLKVGGPMKDAVKRFVDNIKAGENDVTISTGDKSVTIKGEGKKRK